MAHSVVTGAAIEGEKLKLQTRKFDSYPPKRVAETKQVRYTFKMGMHSDAEIAEAYPNPQAVCIYRTSMVCVGDKISGQTISGWALKPLGPPNISKGSGTHSASHLSISGGCYSWIAISPREILENAEFQKDNPPIVQIPYER